MTDFASTVATGYAVDGPAIDLGRGLHEGKVHPDGSATACSTRCARSRPTTRRHCGRRSRRFRRASSTTRRRC